MICPHCNESLLRRERPDLRCSKCERVFALEPKTSPAGLHDVRVRKLADKLSDGGSLQYTWTQFMWLAMRQRLPSQSRRYDIGLSIWFGVILLSTYVLCITGMTGFAILEVIGCGVALIFAGWFVLWLLKPIFLRFTTVRLPIDRNEFMKDVFGRWTSLYGEPPPGSVDERTVYPRPVAQPRFALLCPDVSVLACLTVNRVPDTYAMALAQEIHEVPGGVPVLVLHDAGPVGFEQVARARDIFGDRVVNVGLSPAMVMDNEFAILLRERRIPRSKVRFLRRQSLTREEVDWLAEGWWSPLAAVAPRRLITAVSRAVDRIDAADPERQQARRIGFLTWPSA